MNGLRQLRLVVSPLVNLFLLAGLAGALYLGHRTHWKVPAFADLWGEPGHHPAGKPPPAPESGASSDDLGGPVVFDSPEAVQQSGIECEPAVERPLDVLVQANAVVGYDQTRVAQLSSRVPGVIWKVNVRVGQFVRRGDVLIVVDSQEVGKAKADLLQEAAASAFQERRLRQLREGARNGSVPDATVRQAEAAAEEARIRRFNAQQRLINLGLDVPDLTDTPTEELHRRLQFLGLPDSLVREIGHKTRTANLLPLVAPFDGVVTRLDVVVGERAAVEQPQLVMADVRRLWLRLALRKEDVDRVEIGQPVQFTADGNPAHTAEGRLTWISTEVDEKTRTVQARAEVDNPRSSPSSTAQIRVAHLPRAVLVPSKAVQRLGTTALVFVRGPDGKSFLPRKVELGTERDGRVHIRDGLTAGEPVAVSNSYVLKSELLRDSLVGGP
jgi:cobalt-zinc-cadmium efflux system membrane fusion protein